MTMAAKFAGKCVACHHQIAVGEQIDWTKGIGARHATQSLCDAAKAATGSAPAAAGVTVNLKAIADFIGAAKARGLKFPKARFLAPGSGELRLSVAGEQSKFPGSIQVVVRDEWIGRVRPDGQVDGKLATDMALILTLTTIALDPAKAAKEYGALMGRCSFCDTTITDEGSIEVGYGPVCAKNFGLPHTPKGTRILTKAVA